MSTFRYRYSVFWFSFLYHSTWIWVIHLYHVHNVSVRNIFIYPITRQHFTLSFSIVIYTRQRHCKEMCWFAKKNKNTEQFFSQLKYSTISWSWPQTNQFIFMNRWLLFYVKWAMFHRCHGATKLYFNDEDVGPIDICWLFPETRRAT